MPDIMTSFNERSAAGIRPNLETIDRYVKNSLMLVTALNPHIGYEKAAAIAKLAYQEGITLKEAALRSNLLTEREFDDIVRPEAMI
jgi:fumarate hydratase class II